MEVLHNNSLIAKEGCTHATCHDVDGDAERDEETGSDSVHAGKIGDGSRTTQDQHGRDDDVSGETKEMLDNTGVIREIRTRRRGRSGEQPDPIVHRRFRAKCERWARST